MSTFSEILPFLYVGRHQDALDENQLVSLGFTHLLNVMDSCRFIDNSKLVRLHVPISDYGDSDLASLITKCCEFIESARINKGKVLLHCGRGQNRSPSVATAYLMKCQKMSLKEAFYHIRRNRSEFAPHEKYLEQLQKLDVELYGALSLTEEEEPLSVQAITRRIAKDLGHKE